MKAIAFIVALSLGFTLGLTKPMFGELPESSHQKTVTEGIGANFSVEADLHADLIQFGPYAGTPGTDDWFDNATSGMGIGVIDTTDWAIYRGWYVSGGVSANRSLVKRMSFPKNSVQNGYLLFDAVCARDWHSCLSALDSSVFTGIQEKNIDNPSTWNIGTKGTPNKNDLVDGFAHMRYDGPTEDDSLWLIVGSSTMASNGDAHNDYEFFRVADTLAPGATSFSGTGPDSGHTAWTVDGGTLSPGDMIFSVDFQSGGANPVASIRIWIEEGTEAAITAASAATGDTILFSGIFNGGGSLAGNYGYAELDTGKIASAAFARSNGILSDPDPHATLAAPWGSLEGSYATFQDSILELQFAEAAINLTALGLDEGATGDPCSKLFGYVLFKTRSSQSFTAELKDFIGPFAFSGVVDVECVAIGDSACAGGAVVLDTVSVSCGTRPYEFCWDAPPYDGVCDYTGMPWTIDPVSLSDAGTYRLIVVDADSCLDTCYADLAILDCYPPEAIDDLSILLTGDDIHLQWIEPYDDVGVDYYEIYRSTVPDTSDDSIGVTLDVTYIDSGVVGIIDTSYYYTVKAVDAAGRKSEHSNIVGEFDKNLTNSHPK